MITAAKKPTGATKTATKKSSTPKKPAVTKKTAAPNRAQRRAAERATKAGHAHSPHARWVQEAMLVDATDNPLTIPINVFREEAREVATFVTRYWNPVDGLPGLSRLRNRLPESTAQEIKELLAAAQWAQTEATLAVTLPPPGPDAATREQAEGFLTELSRALAFTLDDDVDDHDDQRHARVKAFHAKRDDSPTALGQDLLNHATLAARLRDRLTHDDEDFDPSVIDESLTLAARLTTATVRPPPADGAEASAASSDAKGATVTALALRNRMLHLLVKRIARVRSAAKRVFADHPDVLAKVTSAYEREQRALRRKARKSAEDEAPTTPPPANG